MGSASYANPTDNRLAVTDNAFGMTSSISGNNSNLGYSPNSGFRNAHDVSYLEAGSNLLKGNTMGDAATLNFLDGGAIDQSFDFAKFSLSSVLSSFVDGQKATVAASTQQANTIGQALTQAAATQAAAAQATTQTAQQAAAAQAANAEKLRQWLAENGKKALIGAGVLGFAWWYFKGRK